MLQKDILYRIVYKLMIEKLNIITFKFRKKYLSFSTFDL